MTSPHPPSGARPAASSGAQHLTCGPDPLASLAALLPDAAARHRLAANTVAGHLADHGGYVAWSGGRDSTAALLLARQANPHVPVCLFDSGLEFPETLTYVHDLADRLHLNLHLIPVAPDALSVLVASGAWDHDAPTDPTVPDLHEALITGPARIARAQFGAAEVWGVRTEESAGRAALLAPGRGRFGRADGTQVCSPVWSWRTRDVSAYLASQGVPENPVYARLAALGARGRALRVGLMLDANGLAAGRGTYLRRGWPDQWARLVAALPRLAEWR